MCVVRKMGNKAFLGGFGDVKNKKLFGSFLIFSIQCSRGKWSEDELIYFQDKHGQEGWFGGLVGHSTANPHRNPGPLGLKKIQNE